MIQYSAVKNEGINKMQIGAGGLTKLAEMICGDKQYSYFPYRSSSYLTRFFIDLDLEYVHDGSTRRHWVNDILKDINNQHSQVSSMPSPNMIKVIESVVHPEYFLSDQNVDHERALEAVISLLKVYDLIVTQKPNGQVTLSPSHGEFVSTAYEAPPAENLITFKPSVFNVPNRPQNEKLVSVMMHFNGTYDAVKRVADHMGLECLRADDIWDNSTIMQDIIDLIFCAKIVVVDFTGRNSNVMYKTDIAHTLGKVVVPITQSIEDIPSDLGNHRALKYLPNEEGYRNLSNELYKRLEVLVK
jgi:hypothetical protein